MSVSRSPLSGIKAVLFDLDGVVIDSEPLHLRSKQITFAEFGLPVPEDEFRSFYGRTDLDVVSYTVRSFGPHLDIEEVMFRKQAVYAALINELPLVPGVDRVMDAFAAAGVRLALVTSAAPLNQQLAFEKFGLHGRFEFVLTAADVSHPKPHPEPYLRAAAGLELEPQACLVIEDSVNGVRAGVAAGCGVIGITTSFPAEALHDAGATIVVETYAELAKQLGLPPV